MKNSKVRLNRKEFILDTAVICFVEYGYHKASMDMIAEASSITKRGLYYHFKSKDELFIEIFRHRGQKYFERVKKELLSAHGSEEQIYFFIERGIAFLFEDDIYLRFLVEFMSIGARNQKVKKVITEYYQDSIHRIQRFLKEGIKSGDFQPHDTEKVSRTIFFVGLGKFFAYCSVNNMDFEMVEQHRFDIKQILKGLRLSVSVN